MNDGKLKFLINIVLFAIYTIKFIHVLYVTIRSITVKYSLFKVEKILCTISSSVIENLQNSKRLVLKSKIKNKKNLLILGWKIFKQKK